MKSLIRDFIRWESSAGVVLFCTAVLAIGVDNSPWSVHYKAFFDAPVIFQWGAYRLDKPLMLWVNEGLMTVFFLLVGLEIKRELLTGELNTWSKAMLPVIIAVGGMVVPALIYFGLNHHDPQALQGWAIPVATDIAFALGIVSLLGSRVPTSLKVLLTAVAIFDDVGAIFIIGIYYAGALHIAVLFGAGCCLVGLYLLNRFRVMVLWPYFVLGAVMWLMVLESGLHATLTGVLLAATIPLRCGDRCQSPARWLEARLLPWVAWLVLPLFAFANAGVSFSGVSVTQLWHTIPLGITLGLVVGKPLGVVVSAWLTVKAGWVRLPDRTTWQGIWGVAFACGVGFTMSLFIGTLAFDESHALAALYVRWGVLSGSCIAGFIAYVLLRHASQSNTVVQH